MANAYSFAATSTDKIDCGTGVTHAGTAYSVAIRLKPHAITGNHDLLAYIDSANALSNVYLTLYEGAVYFGLTYAAGSWGGGNWTCGWTADVEHVLVFTFDYSGTTTACKLYADTDSTPKATGASPDPSAVDVGGTQHWVIGNRMGASTNSSYADIYEVAWWPGVILTGAQAAALGAGGAMAEGFPEPANYWFVDPDASDLFGGADGTITGASAIAAVGTPWFAPSTPPTIAITTPAAATLGVGAGTLALAGTASAGTTSVTWRTNQAGTTTTPTLGSASVIVDAATIAAAGLHVWPDGPLTAHDNGDGTYTFWASAGGDTSGIGRSVGTLANPLATSTLFLNSSTFSLKNQEGTEDYCGDGSVYKDPTSGRLILFAHAELHLLTNQFYAYITILTSTDGGDTWTECGEIITPYVSGSAWVQWKTDHSYSNGERYTAEIGTGSFLIVGPYFYVYYNYCDVSPPTTIGLDNGQVGLARAPVADVITAAASGTVPVFKKWTADGLWSANGIHGQGDYLPTLDAGADWTVYFAPAYNSYLGAYCGLLKVYTGGSDSLLYTESDDGITWTTPLDLSTRAYDYNSIVPAGPTRTVGRTFTRFFQDIPGTQGIHSQSVALQKTDGTATGTTSWSVASVTLRPGRNVLTATAHNAAGQTDATVTVDYAPLPVLAHAGGDRGD